MTWFLIMTGVEQEKQSENTLNWTPFFHLTQSTIETSIHASTAIDDVGLVYATEAGLFLRRRQ